MSSLLSAELAATCNALGYFDVTADKYYADSNTLETVKDLIRYLRRDDENYDIRRQLGDTKVLKTDLLPLLKSYWEEDDLFDVLLRLVVNLTTPPLILWNEQPPTERLSRNYFLQIDGHLRSYKQSFADDAIWAVLSTRLSKILEIDFAERGDDNSLIIERILILIRNILYIPTDPDSEKRTDNDASIHDQVLWALHQSGMLDIILYITSSPAEQVYYMHILEILYFMLREQSASELGHSALQRSETEKVKDEAELLAIRHRETNQKLQKIRMYNGTRHSRFGGTFVVKSMKSISDNELIYHKPLSKLDALNFDVDKTKPKTPKNRLPLQDTALQRRSAFSIRLFLKEFCVEFLNGAYNTLMCNVKRNLLRAKAQAHDESYYLWALRFFMEFNRCYKFEVKLVSETMSVQSFHFVQQQMENYFDILSTEKKNPGIWSRRLHLALLAYKELLLTICSMDKSSDETVRNSARVIKSNIFYVLEYRELILTLLITYDELKISQLYLNDLIETQHIFLKMFESFCGKGGSVIVQKKSRAKTKGKKKKAAAASSDAATTLNAIQMNLEDRWDEAASQLSTLLSETMNFPTDVVPFDATSEVPIDEQKGEAMKNIQRKLRDFQFETAIGLLRAAREVWPENDSFGTNNMPPEEEFLALREIFFADLGENVNAPTAVAEPEEQNEDEEEEDDDDNNARIEESDLKVEDFIKRLAHPKIVRACGLALSRFEEHCVNTNHCIVKLLHRIAFDCKMYVMVFQSSIFRTFQKIYRRKDMPQYKELVKFATYIMRQFFKVCQKNPKLFMEVLFWTSSRDVLDIEEGYGTYEQQSAAASKAWTEIEEDELRRLFMEHQENQLQDDVVDWILNNLINNTRTRRGVLKKLKEMYLLTDYKGPRKSGVTAKIPKTWSAQEEEQLCELFEEFKDAMDPLGCIIERLNIKRPKNRIIEKLLVMGLIQDKKEVRKKRSRKPGNTSRRSQNANSESDSSDSGDEETNAASNRNIVKPTARNSKKSKIKALLKTTSSVEISKLILDIINLEMLDALQWLKESFEDAVEDLENDDEDIPLVPILQCAIDAIENADFQKLLKAFGIMEPFDEQETYWRIPSTLTQSTLQGYIELLTQAVNGTLVIENQNNPNTQPEKNDESSDEDVFEKLREITSNFKTNSLISTKIAADNSENDSNSDNENASSSIKNKNRLNETNSSDDDMDNQFNDELVKGNNTGTVESNSENESSTKLTSKNRQILESDDENTDESNSKRTRTTSDSSSEKPVKKRLRVISSDEDD